MRNIKVILILLLAFSLGLTSSALAQANNLAKMYHVKVKAGHGPQFEAALKTHVEWRKAEGDPWTWDVYQVANGQNLGDFYIRSGEHTWADLDSYAEFLAKGAEEWERNVASHIESISSTITAVDTTNFNWHPNPTEVKLISIITHHLKPGKQRAYAQAVNKYHTTIMDNNRKGYYAFDWNVNGGAGPTVSIALPYTSWADMQGPEESLQAFMSRILGAEEAMKLSDEFNSTIMSAESMVLQSRPDLSVLPGT